MTTEELARRFCELVGWEHGGMGERLFYAPHAPVPGVRGNIHPFPDGWAGVGIVVDEMRRRGCEIDLSVLRDGYCEVDLYYQCPGGVRGDRDHAASEGKSVLDAVLAAAIAALEAEAGR